MLKKSHFLLEIFGILIKCVLVSKVLAINSAALDVVKVIVVGVEDDLSGVVEEDASCIIAEVVA